MTMAISKSNGNNKTKTLNLCHFELSKKNLYNFEPLSFCTFKPKSVYLQNGISNWRYRISWCAFIASFN